MSGLILDILAWAEPRSSSRVARGRANLTASRVLLAPRFAKTDHSAQLRRYRGDDRQCRASRRGRGHGVATARGNGSRVAARTSVSSSSSRRMPAIRGRPRTGDGRLRHQKLLESVHALGTRHGQADEVDSILVAQKPRTVALGARSVGCVSHALGIQECSERPRAVTETRQVSHELVTVAPVDSIRAIRRPPEAFVLCVEDRERGLVVAHEDVGMKSPETYVWASRTPQQMHRLAHKRSRSMLDG